MNINRSNSCAAALGRKVRIWERQLMRDFHVSPALGSESHKIFNVAPASSDSTVTDQFRHIVKLAMVSKASDSSSGNILGWVKVKTKMKIQKRSEN